MVKKNKKKTDLTDLINIGPKSAEYLFRAGIKSIKDLKRLGAEKAYEKMCKYKNKKIHPAFLYVMRAALWFEKNKDKREMAKMWWMFQKPSEGKVKK